MQGVVVAIFLIFVARPLAAVVSTAFSPFDMRERLMLGWAGLRGAVPIWLATFPVIDGIDRPTPMPPSRKTGRKNAVPASHPRLAV